MALADRRASRRSPNAPPGRRCGSPPAPSAFPAQVLDGVAARTGCQRADRAAARAGRDSRRRHRSRRAARRRGRRPGRLGPPRADRGAHRARPRRRAGQPARRRARCRRRTARHAVPVEPAAAPGAPLGLRRPSRPASLRSLFSLRGASRAALPDSPLELALAARYLGIGDPFALDRDELRRPRAGSSRQRVPLLHLYRERRRLALALPPRRDRPRARQPGDARRPARQGRRESCRARARSRPSGSSASSRARAARSARAASPAACCAPVAQARLAAVRGLVPVRAATCSALSESALRGAPAGALADAREQLDGGSSNGFRGRHGMAGMGGGMGAPAGVIASP